MKQFLTIHHKIQELIAVVTCVASLIAAIVMMAVIKEPVPTNVDLHGNVTHYGSIGFIIMMPIMMLPTVLILLAVTHFFPLSMWNLPVKPKPGREVKLYRISAYMVTLMNMQTGIFSLVFTLAMGLGWVKIVSWLGGGLCAVMFVTIAWAIIASILANR
ncbi:MAG: hypothetical protein K6A05_03520 [Lachnospiraceae bacterium]|nr:hypothetical protein [Lachnospiraceae bacterium]